MRKPKIYKKLCRSHSPRGTAIKYIVIHWTGALGTAKNNADYFARTNPQASAHFFVDSKSIWQSVPTYRSAWSVGGSKYPYTKGGKNHGKCTNANSISIELCCIKRRSRLIVDPKAIKRARALVQWLMAEYDIPESRVIRHYDVTGKTCPRGYLSDRKWKKLKKLFLTEHRQITSNRLRVRSGVCGKHRYWLYKGREVTIYRKSKDRKWGRISKFKPRWISLSGKYSKRV